MEEKVDALIEAKQGLSDDVLAGGEEVNLTEMRDEDLLKMVSLDLKAAMAE
jgi:non-specific serine/threonine protein kinase